MANCIDPFRHVVESACKNPVSIAEITHRLQQAGCEVKEEWVRVWVKDETAASRLQRERPTKRGRPRKDKRSEVPKTSPKVATRPSVLPILGDSHDPFDDMDSVALLAVFGPSESSIPREDFEDACIHFGIPLTDVGEMDLIAWAEKLGLARVNDISDIEFFVLESLQKTWRTDERWSNRWIRSVRQSAAGLRREMREAAGVADELKQISSRAGFQSRIPAGIKP